jgi:hypothetical protein
LRANQGRAADTAVAERFFARLKRERIRRRTDPSRETTGPQKLHEAGVEETRGTSRDRAEGMHFPALGRIRR